MTVRPGALPALALALAACAHRGGEAPGAAGAPPGYRLLFEETFESDAALARFTFTDPAAWRISRGDADGVPSLELAGPSRYEPAVRSPRSLALVAGIEVGDFDLEVDLLSTKDEYPHRDLVLVFGHESPDRFYYVHLASRPDENAHNVFVVDRAPRAPLAPVPARGVDWNNGGKNGAWHRFRLSRRGGDVEVSLDGEVVLAARDTRIARGRVGLGSFDDTGRFARLRVWGP